MDFATLAYTPRMWIVFSLLSSASWASTNIVDSILVHRYEKHPQVLMWFVGVIRIATLIVFALLFPIFTEQWYLAFAAGMIIYTVAVFYLYILRSVDTSITQSAWAIESIYVSIFGFFVLAERWSVIQSIGAVLILLGVFGLCYWHRSISVKRSLFYLCLLALMTAPSDIILKYTLDHGSPYVQTLFWYICGTSCFAAIAPLFRPATCKQIRHVLATAPVHFYTFNVYNITISMVGFATMVKAFALGPLSLVTIATNIQPFLVILFSGLLMRTRLIHIPNELLSKQSIGVKLACFTLSFTGLALLVVNGNS